MSSHRHSLTVVVLVMFCLKLEEIMGRTMTGRLARAADRRAVVRIREAIGLVRRKEKGKKKKVGFSREKKN